MPDPLTPLAILDRLVAFPTVSRDTNLPLIDWVEGYLAGHGIAATRVPDPGQPHKASLYASVGPDLPGGVILSGHSDVVPVDGQDWTTDPWTVTERDGRLYGRGTCDMKGFVALAIWALVEGRRAGVARPMTLALSHDEEVGCTGCLPMVAALAARLPRPVSVIVGEPTTMRVVTGHKGGTAFKVHVKGHEVHSSLLHQGVSAILEAGRLIAWVNALNDANRGKVPSPLAALFDPPWTTMQVGMIHGGTAHNITAGDCHLTAEMRVIPDESVEDHAATFLAEAARIEAGMRRVHPGTGVAVDRYFNLPPLRPEPEGAAEALARGITGDNGTHVVGYGTEAPHFQTAGFSAVVCGPGDIAQAHQPDEFLSVAEFRAGEDFMRRLIEGLAAA
jgi:acetylornithine deacetylase